MKLEAIAKSLFAKNLKKIILIFLILSNFEIYAQKHQYKFDNEPLSDVLLKLSKELNFKVAFDASTLAKIPVDKNVNGNSVEELLDKLLVSTGFEYQYKHGNYLIFKQTAPLENDNCRIIGTITDEETNESLPYATIKAVDKNDIIPSSSNGTFYLTGKSNIHLNIRYIGYKNMDTSIECKSSIMNCYISLRREALKIGNVIVKEPKIEMVDYRNDVDFATTINPLKLNDLPVMAEADIFKALQMLPGISYSENSSELNIRGGTGDQNLILFDGQTLYNLSHYYGVFSSLNPNIIKDIQVYKGGYDSRYGERVSGIVDITGKTGNQLKPMVYGDVNMVSGNITTEIPVSDKLTVVAAARRSYTDIYSTEFASNLFEKSSDVPKGNNPNDFVAYSKPSYFFYDFNSKVTYKRTAHEEFSMGFYGGRDHYRNEYRFSNRNGSSHNLDMNNWSNYGINAYWQKQWNSSLFTKIQAGTSGYDSKSSDSRINEDSLIAPGTMTKTRNVQNANRNRLTDISFSFKNIFTINENNQVYFGLMTRYNNVLYNKITDQQFVYDNLDQHSIINTLYFQDKINISRKFKIKPGARLNYYDGTHKLYFEPRFSASYSVNDAFSLRFSTGRFFQYICQASNGQEVGYNKNFWVLSDGKVHPVIRSDHFIFGSTYEIGNFLFDAEAYFKNFRGVQEYIFVSPYMDLNDFKKFFKKKTGDSISMHQDTGMVKPSFFLSGNGYAYGLDFSIRFKKANYTSWLSYTFNKTRQRFHGINNYNYYPASTDQTHQLNWANMLSFGKWNFGLTNIFSTGKPFIEYTIINNVPELKQIRRLPNYYRTDISANYSFSIKNVHFKAGTTLINLLDQKNYFDLNTKSMQNSSFSETNIIEAQGFSLNFYLHFAF